MLQPAIKNHNHAIFQLFFAFNWYPPVLCYSVYVNRFSGGGMDKTTATIALTGLLHDVGKFSERAGIDFPPGYGDNNAGLYQPYRQEQKRHNR